VDRVTIETENKREAYRPGEELRGVVTWEFASPAKGMEVRLFWYTRGKGTQDVKVVKIVRFDPVTARGRRDFRFVLPDSPYSFSGKLVSLVWAIEVIADPGERTARMDLVIAPEGKEIVLDAVS
jgi:hypothetical protein